MDKKYHNYLKNTAEISLHLVGLVGILALIDLFEGDGFDGYKDVVDYFRG